MAALIAWMWSIYVSEVDDRVVLDSASNFVVDFPGYLVQFKRFVTHQSCSTANQTSNEDVARPHCDDIFMLF